MYPLLTYDFGRTEALAREKYEAYEKAKYVENVALLTYQKDNAPIWHCKIGQWRLK